MDKLKLEKNRVTMHVLKNQDITYKSEQKFKFLVIIELFSMQDDIHA